MNISNESIKALVDTFLSFATANDLSELHQDIIEDMRLVDEALLSNHDKLRVLLARHINVCGTVGETIARLQNPAPGMHSQQNMHTKNLL